VGHSNWGTAQQAFCSRPIEARFFSQGLVSPDVVFRRLKMGVGQIKSIQHLSTPLNTSFQIVQL
jgi:hypothetical protein